MDEPSLRSSRLAIAGGLLAAIVLAGGGFLLGRTTLPRPEPVAPAPLPVPAAVTTPTEAAGALTRADILRIGTRAADALASGLSDTSGPPAVAGRRFEIAIAFGCEGSTARADAGPLHWNYDAAQQTLRIHAAPTQWSPGDWGDPGQPDDTGASLQGFWINYPWASAENCPQPLPAPAAESPSMPDGEAAATGEPAAESDPANGAEHSLAVAEVLRGEMTTRRGDRPYEIVKRIGPDRFDPGQGFRLRLLGRIDRLPNGESVKCVQPGGIEQRPACVVAMSLNEVRIENPLDGEVLATWTTHLADRTSR